MFENKHAYNFMAHMQIAISNESPFGLFVPFATAARDLYLKLLSLSLPLTLSLSPLYVPLSLDILII